MRTFSVPDFIDEFLASLDAAAGDESDVGGAVPESFDWCLTASDDDTYRLFAQLAGRPAPNLAQDASIAALFRVLLGRDWTADAVAPARLPSWFVGQAALIYQGLGAPSRARAYLTQLITTFGDVELAQFAEWIVVDPPPDFQAVLISFAPLFQRGDFDPSHVFPRLLDALAHPVVAASVIDLANFVTTEGLIRVHPATDWTTRLVGLLGQLNQRLSQLEEKLGTAAGQAAQLAAAVEESVSLAVGLCRAFALMGDELAVGKLFQTLELRHRRLRAEAAAALVALEQPAGIEALAALAAEPIVRLRVLAYADELGCLDHIDERNRTDEARAEAELSLWLSQPAQLGLPPTSLECVDQQAQYWPGYDDEINCFLFRYSYQFADGEFSNIGIAGPLTHAFSADIGDLSPDDIYAAFAGWQAEHEDIYEIDVTDMEEAQRVEVTRLERRLLDDGYDEVRPIRLGYFFGERALVARATRSGVDGIAVADRDAVQWRSTANKTRPIGPDEMYFIYKGKKLLRNFNE